MKVVLEVMLVLIMALLVFGLVACVNVMRIALTNLIRSLKR